MTKGTEAERKPGVKSRMRHEIVEAMRGLLRVESMSPAEITAVREGKGISQAVLAGFMNVAVNTVSQWERGERRPTGAALKLLNVVKNNGLDVLR